jgi:Domain of unknown function (DUF5615)
VRLILDAHVSGRRVGGRLHALGHDVRALDQEPELEGLPDDQLLQLAAEDDRVLVTHDVADFPRVARSWAESGRSHAGVILVYGITHGEFDLIARGVARWCARRPRQADWRDATVVVDRSFAAGDDERESSDSTQGRA